MDPFAATPSQLGQLIARLTPRQLEIVELLAKGHTIGDAATILSIGTSAVKHHIWRACQRTDIENRIQLIVVYVRWKETNGKQRDIHPEAK